MMKCKDCGKKIPRGEICCPSCGGQPELSDSKNDKKMLIAAAVVAVAMIAGGTIAMTLQPQLTSAEAAAEQHSMISYNTAKELYTLLPENHQELCLYRNKAKDLNSYATFKQVISGNSAYIGAENFVRLDGEVLFLQTEFHSYDSGSGSMDIDYSLCSVKNGKITVVDTDVQGITCASKKSAYYIKTVDGATVQYRYSNGEITAVNELIQGDVVMVTHCSDDDSVLGFASAYFMEDGSYQLNNGYTHGQDIYRFGHGESEVYYVSKDGAHVYIIDIPESGARAVNMRYVNIESGETIELVEAATEISFYEEDGSMTCIGEVELSDEVMNPVGKVIHFDPESKTISTVAENAVALVESMPKAYPWLNESANEMLTTEQGGLTTIPETVKKDSFHYIDKNGSFCAADLSGNVFEVYADFYDPENYVYSSELYYLSEQNDAFLWAVGDKVYRYKAGSMAAAEIVSLDAELLSKVESGSEIGYVLAGDGSVVEQSGKSLTVKPFDGASYSLYDAAENIYIIGLSSKGDKIYFSNDAGTLYEKEIRDGSEAVVVAENIYDAVTVENGLYLLTNYGEDGGKLQYMAYDSNKITTIRDGVLGIADIALQ